MAAERGEPPGLRIADLHPAARGGEVANLLLDGYHGYAVWESAGALLERVRDLTDPDHPGSRNRARGLSAVERLFAPVDEDALPRITFNPYSTENEINEHQGLVEILTGAIRALRHPFSHNFRGSMSRTEAIEWLAVISALHRRIDAALAPAALPASE